MKKTRFFIFLLMALLLAGYARAQQNISGRVVSNTDNEPLAGVRVVLIQGGQQTITNLKGEFKLIDNKRNDSLHFYFFGYKSLHLKIQDKMLVQMELLPNQLSQVVVSASRDKQNRKDVPIAISSITAKELANNQATSLEQVLNKVNGVYMVDLGNEQHTMSIRQPISYGGLYLYLEDGIPIRTTGVFNHNALIELNMANIHRIEVIKGPASSMYGSGAIGGAINFISKNPTPEPSAKLQVQVNNLGYKRTDMSVSNSWKNFGLVASGYYAKRSHGPRAHSDFDKLAFSLRGDWHISGNTFLYNTISYIDYKSDMTGSLDSLNFFTQDFSSLQTFTYRKVNALRVRSTLKHYWSKSSKTSLTAFFRDNSIGQNPTYRIKNDFEPWSGEGNPLLAHGEENENAFRSYGLIAQHKQQVGFLNANWITGASLDYSPNDYQANYIRVDKNTAGIFTDYHHTDSLLADYKVGIINAALYSHLEISPIERLKLVVALRFDQINYDYNNFLDSTAFSGAPDEKNGFEKFTPKLGLTYDFGKGIGVYANYSMGFAPPSVNDLYRGVKVPQLRPATYNNYEFGGWLPLANNKAYVELSLYQMDGKDEIVNIKQADGSYEKENAGKTRHRGVEYQLNYSPTEQISFRFSGTNVRHTYLDFKPKGSDYSGNSMGAAPKFIANAEIIYRPTFLKNARIAFEWQHLAKYYLDEANTEEYPGFDLVNIRLAYQLQAFKLWFHTLNVGNRLYATVASKSDWGKTYNIGNPRTFNIGIAYTFNEKTK